jgi:hypothetical protein
MEHERDEMAPRTFAHSKVEAVNAQLRAKGLPPIEPVGPVRDDLLSDIGEYTFDESSLDDQVDRWCESDAHLERFAGNKLAQFVASEILEQNHDWTRTLRGLDPLNWMHFDPEIRKGYSSVDEQLHTFYTEFANAKDYNGVAFWVYTDSRKTKPTKPVLTPVPLTQPTPIEHLRQYRKVVERRLDPVVKGCQLNLSFQCLQTRHNQMFAYKQGEFVCAATCCRHCIALFDVPDAEYHLSRPVGSFELTGRTFGEPS